jgi:hypothetical protein
MHSLSAGPLRAGRADVDAAVPILWQASAIDVLTSEFPENLSRKIGHNSDNVALECLSYTGVHWTGLQALAS